MRRKSQTVIEIPRIGIKAQGFLGLFYLILVSKFEMFVLLTPILISIIEMFVLKAY